MKLVLLFVGYEVDLVPFETAVHPALLPLANSCLLGHGVAEVVEPGVQAITLVVNEAATGETLQTWLTDHYPALACDVVVTLAQDAVGAVQAVAAMLDEQAVFLATGQTAFDIRWASFGASAADMIFWAAADAAEAGVYWLRDGRDLARAAAGLASLAELPTAVSALGRTVEEQRPDFCAPIGSLESWLFANARLLSLGFASDDAIERGYGDEFVVLPPVFVHETAVVEQCVIGPFVTIGANAEVTGSVIGNSIIGAEARIENASLTETIVGQGGQVLGKKERLVVVDDEVIGD